MLGSTLWRKVSYLVKRCRGDVVAVIAYGSSVYWGRGRDLDLLVVVKEYRENQVADSIELRLKLNKALRYERVVDVQVLSLKDFEANLKPGTWLSGLALGYKVLLCEDHRVERLIQNFMKELSSSEVCFINRYGRWSLGAHARTRLRLSHGVREESATCASGSASPSGEG